MGAGIAIAAFVAHPFGGIKDDSRIYIGRALADLDPDHVGRDLMFRLDGQSGFTIFRPLARWMVAQFGPETAAWLLATSGLLTYSVAVFVCIRTFEKGRPLAVILATGLLLPRAYAPFDILTAGEALAIPRPWAEAFVLLAIACLAKGRIRRAFALVGLAAAFHPIMALPGGILLFLALCTRDRRWLIVAAVCALAVGVAAALGAPVVARVFTRIDPTWLGILHIRDTYLFVTTWSIDAWARIVVQAATVLVASRFVPPVWSRIFVGTVLVALAGCIASLVGVDLLSSLLLTQVQPWRSLWLLAALAPVAAGICLAALPRHDWKGRAVLATLAAAWMAPLLAPSNALLALLALGLATREQLRLDARLSKAICLGAASIVGGALVSSGWIARDYLAVLPSDMRITTSDLWRLSFAAFGAVALVAWFAAGRRASTRLCAALCLLAGSILATTRYDERSAAKADLDTGGVRPDLVALLASRPGEVLWLGEEAVWYLARRPSWNERAQGAGLVFSREQALLWYDRTKAVIGAHLGEEDLLEFRKPGAAHPPAFFDAGATDELCRRKDAPAWIVMDLQDGSPAPSAPGLAIWTSPVDQRVITTDGDALVVRSASRRLLIPCAASEAPSGPAPRQAASRTH